MTSRERAFGLWSAVNTVIDNDIPGAFVECGVWKGGSSMLIALTLLSRGVSDRELFMFDTFAGMTEPGAVDQDINNKTAAELMAGSDGEAMAELVRAAAPIDGVRAAMESTGYNMAHIRFIEGDVRQTLVHTQTLGIALLRLDTDFYDSTMAELLSLYPRLAQGGIIIIDDYGHWQGAQRAVDDYFRDPNCAYSRPMLWAIDYTGRGGVKIEPVDATTVARYDYLPPGMTDPGLGALFPHAVPGDPMPVMWPYLRKQTPHIWRSDTRHQGAITGNASTEEALCLYNFARQFAGRRGLEIGTHYGWTAAHLVAAGLRLDCIDPGFGVPAQRAAIEEVLGLVPGSQGYRLWTGFSPAIVEEVRGGPDGELWSFAFIDGNHDGTGPSDDAREVLKHLAPDAMVVLHDLTAPDVERGLAVFRRAGFRTRLINTMQILGVAWRGDVLPPDHVADPNVPAIVERHLQKYLASDLPPAEPEPEDEPEPVTAPVTEPVPEPEPVAPQPRRKRPRGMLRRLFGRARH